MSDPSRLRQETEKFLQCLHDPQTRLHASSDLDWILENGDAFQLEEVGSIASMLLKMALEEADNEAREDLFCLVETAERYNPTREYLDYEALASKITSFPSLHGLDFAIMILGSSHQQAHFPVLGTFLEHEWLSIRLLTMDAITELWLDISDNDPEVKHLANPDAARHLSFLHCNPRMHTVSEAEMEQLFKAYRDDTIRNLHTWLATKR
ncbi:hypothetical protein [Ktedonobacter robiniae]|uniref:HEAT repeat domain-containing protein n=1 Tax=Ktedonobacter robiniae TaxID=2778365 RepID=A0ABQ3UK97_9CHLR|nr:hypothetical protein [Ktedonobacter robiniae]GHO53108.1 hypothetical protein KSB_15830 [Ktedonobacter robiniae]